MNNNQTKKYYWGIGLENETYLQFDEPLIVTGEFIQEKIGFERYSIDYRNCYKPGILAPILTKAFNTHSKYKASRMMNSHSLEKLDINFNHKILPTPNPSTHVIENSEVKPKIIENPEFLGKTIMELFLEEQPYSIQSMITQRNKATGAVHFDGDTIEFVTKYFENRTIEDACNELSATKKLFLDKLNNEAILNEKLKQ